MHALILAFVIGVLILQFLPQLPSLLVGLVALLSAILLTLIIRRYFPARKNLHCACFLLSAFLLGANWASFFAHRTMSWSLPKSIEKQTVVVTGYISSLPKQEAERVSFTFDMEQLAGKPQKAKLMLSLYSHRPDNFEEKLGLCRSHGSGLESCMGHYGSGLESCVARNNEIKALTAQCTIQDLTHDPHTIQDLTRNDFRIMQGLTPISAIAGYKASDKWQFTVRLKRPHSTMNPGGFDREKYFFQNRIRATGYVVDSDNNTRLDSKWYHNTINRLRQYLDVKIKDSLRGFPLANLIPALIVGDQSGISQSQWQILRRTGTIHFIVIAGLHIGFVAGFMFFLAKLIFKVFPRLALYIPAPYVGASGALLGAIIYSALAGFSIPTERAVIMIAVFMLSLLLRRNIPAWHSLLLALLAVVLINPLAGLSAGFWLSFAAVAIITYVLDARLGTNKWFRYYKLQMALTLGLIPLTLLFFCETPIVSLPANIITIPVIGFVVIPLCFAGSLSLFFAPTIGHNLLILGEKALEIIWWWLNYLATLPIASWHHNIFNNWIFFATAIGMLMLLAPRGFPRRWICCLWLLPLLIYKPPGPGAPGEVWFTLLDVGQGLSSVVQTKNHVLVFDTGPKFHDSSNAGESIVLPFLKNLGLNKIDMLVVSHNDLDHIGGAESILNSISVASIMGSKPEVFANNAYYCESGITWVWDGVTFGFLHPPKGFISSVNNASCVLKITTGKNSILLTGDIEKETEKLLFDAAPEKLNSSILVVPHHGSRTSSRQRFVDAVSPKYALFATGYLNRFRFPSKTVVKRYLKNNTLLLNTAETGAITFKFTAESSMLVPEIFRETYKRYWHDDNYETQYNQH